MEFKETDTIPKMIKKVAEENPEIYAQYKRIKNGVFELVDQIEGLLLIFLQFSFVFRARL